MTESDRQGLTDPPTPGPTTAADSIVVTLDATGRVDSVAISQLPDELRQPAALTAAFREALSRTVASTLPPAPLEVGSDGRPRVARIRRPERTSLHELVERALEQDRGDPVGTSGPSPGGERGASDNDCVWVVLDPSGPGGDIDADPGWLRQTTSTNAAAAITQAFAAAYRQRGPR